ncbi:hypothetical protein HK104_003529 [Borealophlyctis nickersoniae]|nr:hypothetical protein HK104_003529 [Borealophlyctis nickersoniae]
MTSPTLHSPPGHPLPAAPTYSLAAARALRHPPVAKHNLKSLRQAQNEAFTFIETRETPADRATAAAAVLQGKNPVTNHPLAVGRAAFTRMLHNPNDIQNPHLQDDVDALQFLHFCGIQSQHLRLVRKALTDMVINTAKIVNIDWPIRNRQIAELLVYRDGVAAIITTLRQHDIR